MSKDEIVIDQAVVDAVAKKVTETITPAPTADEIAEKLAEKMVDTQEKLNKKQISEDTKAVVVKYNELPKEVKFAKALKAQISGDYSGLREYNQWSLSEWGDVAKANYQNVTTAGDGGSLVPDPEFIAEIERLTDEYGVVARLADVRITDRDSVTMLRGTNTIQFTATDEATAQNSTKLTYASSTVALKKFICTIPVTSELVEDSAIGIWQDVANEIARARARLFDELVFTSTEYGLLSADAGDAYKTQTIGSAITDLDFDDLMNARYKIASSHRKNGRYFMHPSVWNQLRQKKSGDGTNSSAMYYYGSPANSAEMTIDGVPVELVDVLPERGDITANEAFAVYGDLSRIKMHVKRVLETKVFDAGVVKDAGGSDFNLITQDSYAMRATLRCVPQTRFDGAFCIIGTGTVS